MVSTNLITGVWSYRHRQATFNSWRRFCLEEEPSHTHLSLWLSDLPVGGAKEEDWWVWPMLIPPIMCWGSVNSQTVISSQNCKSVWGLCRWCSVFCVQACLVQLGPKECLLMSPDPHSDSGRLRQLLSRCGLLITDRKRGAVGSWGESLSCLYILCHHSRVQLKGHSAGSESTTSAGVWGQQCGPT